MLLRSVVLLLNLVVARTAVNVSSVEDDSDTSDIDVRYSLWPSTSNSVHSIHGSSVQNKGHSSTQYDAQSNKAPIHDPRVLWASLGIGGLVILATAYYCVIRNKVNTNAAIKPHSSTDQRFYYGVLKSEDNRRNMESSRVPLTMESDEDEEQVLGVFDLGQQKKTLSTNLQQHDEDIVLNDSNSEDLENLLIDIEDKNSDTLMR